MTDEESAPEKNNLSEESEDNAATDLLSIPESPECGEDYNEDPAFLYIFGEQYDEDSNLDKANSPTSAEQEPPRLPPPRRIRDLGPVELNPRLDQERAERLKLHAKNLG